ncbi:MAG: hypothetical protein GX306_08210 [Clostridiales bacterium]|jgi:hypothetical protein|nr:hypothetical protein [Clostridiales bacterium]
MYRRPMLLNKLKNRKYGTRQSIGLIGTHRGVGVTYTAFMLAFYLGEEMGKRTAFVECNRHHDMERIQSAYEWSREDTSSFSFHQITCYKEVMSEGIAEIYNKNYESLIFDFGTDFGTNWNEFLRCNIKIIVGGMAQWNQKKLIELAAYYKDFNDRETWLYLIPCADSKVTSSLKKIIVGKIHTIPFEKDPTKPSKNTIKLFRELL